MRMTRAALRAQESCATPSSERSFQLKSQGLFDDEPMIHEDSDKEESSLQSSSTKNSDEEDGERLALRDITTENYPTPAVDETILDKMPGKKSKKAKVGGGKKKNVVEELWEGNSEEHSSAEATVEHETTTYGDQNQMAHREQDPSHEPENASMNFEESQEHPDKQDETEPEQHSQSIETEAHDHQDLEADSFGESQTVSLQDASADVQKTPEKEIGQATSKTPKFDPELYDRPDTDADENKDVSEDSFVASIKTRSPSKIGHSQATEEKADSFLEDIITRTPSKDLASPRVEDSMKALDELEDAIEKFSEDLPAIQALIVESPIRQRKTPSKMTTPVSQHKSNTTPPSKSKRSPASFTQRLVTSMTPNNSKEKPLLKSLVKERVKEFESRPTVSTHRRATSVSLTKKAPLKATNMPPKSKHVPTKSVAAIPSTVGLSSSNSPTGAKPDLVKKRVASGPLSTSKPAFVPTKSEKPTTKSNFVLPGEAVAAKLKAQREERAKREEKAAEKKSQIKAKAVTGKGSRPSVMPRENKTSQARKSVMPKGSSENKENVAPTRSVARPSGAPVTVAKRRADVTPANTSTRRTTTIAPLANVTSKRTTISVAPVQRITSANSASAVTIKGKEVFERQRNGREAELKEKKEKEEAAKRARAEAAERGRQASREWAEKQKRRLVEKTVAESKTVPA